MVGRSKSVIAKRADMGQPMKMRCGLVLAMKIGSMFQIMDAFFYLRKQEEEKKQD